jgi:hypothetical protein
MTPIAIVRAATINAAELLGMEDRLWTLEPDELAGIMAFPGKPLENMTTLKHATFAMKEIRRQAGGMTANSDGPTEKGGIAGLVCRRPIGVFSCCRQARSLLK